MTELLLAPGQWKKVKGIRVQNTSEEMLRIEISIVEADNHGRYYCMGFTTAVMGGSYNPYGPHCMAGAEWYKGYCQGIEFIKLLGGEDAV